MSAASTDLMCAGVPTPRPARWNNIPQELKERQIWLRWRLEERDGKKTKVPYRSDGGGKAKTNDPTTWSDFETAVSSKVGNGVGCVVKDGLVCIDLDKVRDPATGVIEPWAQSIIGECQSYTEISPSKTGVHIWLRGEVPPGGNRRGRIEMYDYNSPRYLTITDDVLVSKPIRAFDLTSLHQRMLDGADPNYRQSETVHIVNSSVPAHKSHSEEDFALCCKLVRQGKTVEEIKQAMAASELFRLKWSRPDYADRTIAAAFKEVGVVVSISRSRLKVTKASEMKNEIVNWMWKHRIVSGALNLFSGEPGSGKGTLCAYIAARVSTGTDFWDAQNPNPSSKVLMVASEENIRSMVRPKLEVAGADMENIGFLSCEDVIGESVADHDFCVEKNLSLLDEYLKATPDTRLIILDPVINHLSSIDVNKEQDIRRVLTPFKVLVEKYNVAVIMVNHFNKGTGLGLNRVGFSKAFSASTRAAWGFTKEEQTDEFLVQDIRVSNSASGNNFKFKMESKTFTAANGETDETPLAVWAGKTAKLFNDTLVVTSDPEVRKIDRAKTFLLERLKDCKPHVSETLQAEAQQKFGISHDTLYRAYNTLEGHKKPDKNKESGYKWVWQLHGQETPTVVVVDDKTDELGW